MDNFSAVATILAGFVPTWLMLAKVYEDIGRVKQQIKDLDDKLKNMFKNRDDRDKK
ncbi:MAG: hypothetical protein ACXQT4_00375 [Methanotrichaceae archaeon]